MNTGRMVHSSVEPTTEPIQREAYAGRTRPASGRLIRRARGGPLRIELALLALAMAVFLALGIGYARLTPIWHNPDEPAHYNYVAFIARTGGLPELRPGDWDSALLERLKNGQLQPGDSVDSIRYESWQPPLF